MLIVERSNRGEARRIESVSADRKLSRHWCLAKMAFDLGSIKTAPGVEQPLFQISFFLPRYRKKRTKFFTSNRATNLRPINSLSLYSIKYWVGKKVGEVFSY